MKLQKKSNLIAQKKLVFLEIPKKFLTQLKDYNITIDEYLVLYSKVVLKYTEEELENLPTSKSINEILRTIADKNLDYYTEIIFAENLEWVEDWIALWPEGVKQNGVYVRSSANTIREHFKKFLRKYNYTKEEIFQATRTYLTNQAKSNNDYISLSHNFIEKNNVSLLANMCETYRTGGTQNYTDSWTSRA